MAPKQYKTFGEVLVDVLQNPSTREWALDYIADLKRSFREFHAKVPAVVEALRKRGIEWGPEENLQMLVIGERGGEVVECILEAISEVQDERAQRSLVDDISFYKGPYDATPLIELFEGTSSRYVRDSITTLIPQTKAQNADAWMRKVLLDPSYGDCRWNLCIFASFMQNKQGLADILVSVFDEMPLAAAKSLGALAEERHLAVMRQKLAGIERLPEEGRRDLQKTLEHGIAKTERRLASKAERDQKRLERERKREERRLVRQQERERVKKETEAKVKSKGRKG